MSAELICGVDEAGRGALAGRVYAAAVILDGKVIKGLNDSKKLTPAVRDRLYGLITAEAPAWAVAYAELSEILEMNILNAAMLAMNRAVAALCVRPDRVLVDGNIARGFEQPVECIIKGDATVPEIMAASILAKVSRDRYMTALDVSYPGYGFARHKGYGTAAHRAAICSLGASEIHRTGFKLI